MLLSFERPRWRRGRLEGICSWACPRCRTLFADLENCTVANVTGITEPGPQGPCSKDHRQDSKGTWWMPWHQESKKDVNGCDKPRLGAE
jgi:hypothetical protein